MILSENELVPNPRSISTKSLEAMVPSFFLPMACNELKLILLSLSNTKTFTSVGLKLINSSFPPANLNLPVMFP